MIVEVGLGALENKTMNYWEECIKEAFTELGIDATEKQLVDMIDWVKGSHENYSMAHGYDCISNPLENELHEQKQKTKEAEKRAICERENFRNNVARRKNIHPSQVEITDNGDVSYYR